MDTSKVLFRNKGRGYNKDDVNNYIAAENKRFTDAEASFKRSLQEKDRVIEGFSNELYKCNNENYLLKNSVAEKDKAIDSLNARLVESENVIADLRKKIAQLEDEAEKASQSPVTAPAPVQPAPVPVAEPAPVEVTKVAPVIEFEPEIKPKPETIVEKSASRVVAPQAEYEYEDDDTDTDADLFKCDDEIEKVYKKAEAYDRICDQIDEILEHAKNEADHIISTAIDASRKIRSSRSEIDSMKRDISGRSSGIIGEIKKSVVTKRR